MRSIDQGTIFYGFRSKKYPEVPNYAVLISASCDIANKKLSKLYYLTALDAHDWFCTSHGFQRAFSQHINDRRQKLEKCVEQYGINISLLESFDKTSAHTVLSSKVASVDLQSAKQLYEDWYAITKEDGCDTRRTFIRNLDKKKRANAISGFLRDISSGKQFHYHFIPICAYTESSDKTSGIIVDLQEIGTVSQEEAEMIYTPGIDYQVLESDIAERKMKGFQKSYLAEKYWLKTEDDFVIEIGQLKSPWRELLLQRFALDFIRIGVDGSTSLDFECLACKI